MRGETLSSFLSDKGTLYLTRQETCHSERAVLASLKAGAEHRAPLSDQAMEVRQ